LLDTLSRPDSSEPVTDGQDSGVEMGDHRKSKSWSNVHKLL